MSVQKTSHYFNTGCRLRAFQYQNTVPRTRFQNFQFSGLQQILTIIQRYNNKNNITVCMLLSMSDTFLSLAADAPVASGYTTTNRYTDTAEEQKVGSASSSNTYRGSLRVFENRHVLRTEPKYSVNTSTIPTSIQAPTCFVLLSANA
jgi:hypothetical protein